MGEPLRRVYVCESTQLLRLSEVNVRRYGKAVQASSFFLPLGLVGCAGSGTLRSVSVTFGCYMPSDT